jgi:hypothetical protein
MAMSGSLNYEVIVGSMLALTCGISVGGISVAVELGRAKLLNRAIFFET